MEKAGLTEWPFSKEQPNPNPFADDPVVKQNPKLLKLYKELLKRVPHEADEAFKQALEHGPVAAEFHLYKFLTAGTPIPKATKKTEPQMARTGADMYKYTPGRGGIMAGGNNWHYKN